MNSDAILQRNVIDELNWRPSVNSKHIGVVANNGMVTLTGHVENYAQRYEAEDAAKKVYGVLGIANEISVELAGTHKRSDEDIVEAALGALKWNFQVPSEQVKVVVSNGLLTISGTVDWQYQKTAAERCVTDLMGVVAVSNKILLKPEAKWVDVKSKIEAAFRRSADLQAHQITVGTEDGTVTLTGHVKSWADRDQAAWAAWSAPGVLVVKNNLSVSP